MPRSSLVGILLLSSLLPCALTCTTDETVIEGKSCIPSSTDPKHTCVKGYECKCEGGGTDCICIKVQTLSIVSALTDTTSDEQAKSPRLAPQGQRLRSPEQALPTEDWNLRFLRRYCFIAP
jgi:hypothetical protein